MDRKPGPAPCICSLPGTPYRKPCYWNFPQGCAPRRRLERQCYRWLPGYTLSHLLQSGCVSLCPITEAERSVVGGERLRCCLAAISLEAPRFAPGGGCSSHEGRTTPGSAASYLQYLLAAAMVRRKKGERERTVASLPGLVVDSRVSHSSAWGAAHPVPGPVLPALGIRGALSLSNALPLSARPLPLFVWKWAWGILAAWNRRVGLKMKRFSGFTYHAQNRLSFVSSCWDSWPRSPLEYRAQALEHLFVRWSHISRYLPDAVVGVRICGEKYWRGPRSRFTPSGMKDRFCLSK